MWLILALSAALIWGLDYVIAQKVFERNISPITLLSVQMALGAIALTLVGFYKGIWQRDFLLLFENSSARLYTSLAIVGFIVANVLIAFSIKGRNAVLAGIVEISYPLFIVLFSWLLFGTTYLSGATLVGALLIAAGVLLIQFSA